MDSGTCTSCATKSSSDCPQKTKISVPTTIEELTQNLKISFSPSLKSSLPSNYDLSAETFIEKHFNITFKRKEQNQIEPKIINKTLTHDQQGSSLFIEFLEKTRFSNTESIVMTVKDPWVYNPSTTAPNSGQLVYLKEQELTIKITEKQESEQEKDEKTAAQVAQYSSGSIGAIAAATSVTAALTGPTTFFAYLTKFFNVIDIMSNLGSINVQLGPRFKLVMSFIENLRIPELSFIVNLSPIKDSEYDDPDVDAYKLMGRGSRGKKTVANGEVFIIRGQNFVISIGLLVVWISWKVLGLCLSEENKLMGFLFLLISL